MISRAFQFGLALCCASGAFVSTAHAATITHEFTYESSSIPGFDSALGTLDRVDVWTYARVEFSWVVPALGDKDPIKYYVYYPLYFKFTAGSDTAGPTHYNTPRDEQLLSPDAVGKTIYNSAEKTVLPFIGSPSVDKQYQDLRQWFVRDGWIDIHVEEGSSPGNTPNTRTLFDGQVLIDGKYESWVDQFDLKDKSLFYTGKVMYTYSSLAGVPEPSAWALMILGFGAAGSAMRSRHARATARLGYSA